MPDIFIDHKLVFMHNPKCGSRNLRAIARQLLVQKPTTYIGALNDNQLTMVNRKGQQRTLKNVIKDPVSKSLDYTWEHCSLLGIYKLFERFKINPEGFKFLYVIRHPQERLMSGYRYDLKRKFIDPETTFADYILNNQNIEGAHALNTHPIEKFSLNPAGESQIDYLITLENFEAGMRKALSDFEFDLSKINFDAWRHSSADFKLPEALFYTKEELDFIADLWKVDFEMGGYELQPEYYFK